MSAPGFPLVLSFHSSLGEKEGGWNVCVHLASLCQLSFFFGFADNFSLPWSVPIARSRFRAGFLTSRALEKE